jgi:hypothetical protein
MKKSRFTVDQTVRILRGADQTCVSAAAKAHGVSEQTIYTWRKRYGELCQRTKRTDTPADRANDPPPQFSSSFRPPADHPAARSGGPLVAGSSHPGSG